MAELDRNRSESTPVSDAAKERVIDSQKLLGDHGVVRIRHGERVYELRQTRYGKLILTKRLPTTEDLEP